MLAIPLTGIQIRSSTAKEALPSVENSLRVFIRVRMFYGT